MSMFSLPFKNEAHFWWYLAQPQAEQFVKALEEKGLKKIAISIPARATCLPRSPRSSPAHIKGPEDPCHGLPVMVKTMEALGATGVPVAWAELYTALQTGVVDSAPKTITRPWWPRSSTSYEDYTLDEQHGAAVVSMSPSNFRPTPSRRQPSFRPAP